MVRFCQPIEVLSRSCDCPPFRL